MKTRSWKEIRKTVDSIFREMEKNLSTGSYKGIKGGTIGGIPLCRTCRNATYIQGLAESQRLLMCGEFSGFDHKTPMPFEAYECSEYDDKRLPSKRDMENVAWILRTNPKQKGTLGFFSPAQLKEFRKKDLIDDEPL